VVCEIHLTHHRLSEILVPEHALTEDFHLFLTPRSQLSDSKCARLLFSCATRVTKTLTECHATPLPAYCGVSSHMHPLLGQCVP
jgi:hypothetical protein